MQRADVGVLVRLAVSEPAPSRIGRRSIRRARVLVRKPDTQRRQRLIRAMAVGTVRVERQSKGLYVQVRRVPGNRGAGVRVTTPSPAPGWYPDPSDPEKRIYWDGTAWSGPVRPAGVPSAVPASTEADKSNNGKKTAVAIGVGVLVVIGLVMSMQPVILMTGSGPVWTGVAVVAAGTAVAFFLGAATWVRVVAAVLLALSLANGLYIEKQLSDKRDELTHVFDR